MPLIRHRRGLAVLLSLSLGALTSSACHGGASSSSSASASPHASARSNDVDDPCALLEPNEVQAVLGAPLVVPPFLSRDGVPKRDGSACQYEDASLHNIIIDVQWDHGAMTFKMSGAMQSLVDQTAAKGLVKLADGTEIAGEWDEAHVLGCCNFMALRGDLMVTVDVGGSKAPIAAAAKLADAAIKRLDHRLSIDGAANVKTAVAFDAAHRPARRVACTLVTRAEVEAIVGPLSQDPSADDERCVYQHVIEGAYGPTYVVKIRWTGGFSEFRNGNEMTESFTKNFTKAAPLSSGGKEAIESAMTGGDLDANPNWDVAHFSIMGLSAVKKDVLISVDPQGAKSDDAVKLMEKLMSKL